MPDAYPDIHRAITAIFHVSRRKTASHSYPLITGHGRDHFGQLFKHLGYTRGAEIGVRRGDNSFSILKDNPDMEFFCVDPWGLSHIGPNQTQHTYDRYYTRAQRTLAPFNVTFVRKPSMDAVGDFADGSLDCVYIDGNHTFDYCCPDIIFWSKKVRSGGIVAGHDYYHGHDCHVVRAVDAYTASHRIEPWYITQEIFPSFFWVKP